MVTAPRSQLWSTEANNPGPYVGWLNRNPTITFFFNSAVYVTQVSLWSDYPGEDSAHHRADSA
jgi:hypothetical protein